MRVLLQLMQFLIDALAARQVAHKSLYKSAFYWRWPRPRQAPLETDILALPRHAAVADDALFPCGER